MSPIWSFFIRKYDLLHTSILDALLHVPIIALLGSNLETIIVLLTLDERVPSAKFRHNLGKGDSSFLCSSSGGAENK